jgi:hypothetical protein
MKVYYAYVVLFDGVDPQTMTDEIDSLEKIIVNWYRPTLKNTIFVVSGLTAEDLAKSLRHNIDGLTALLVLDAETDRNGWLPKTAWQFLRNPKPAGA